VRRIGDIFNAPIRENIALSNPAAAMESIVRVAQIAGANDFILEMSEGYDTMVGEHGTGLSGGQKQRIAIARALLTDPRILIFDEATSALDYESEQIIQKNLRAICRGRTVLLIAHRLSTLKDADAIMVIERGQLVEFGPRNLLIQKKGLFYQMLMRQQEAILEDAPKLPES
jgi:subfamily B ATP-binding cassette protein HlyB/CyaB